jgi:hypothetical protein
MRALLPEPAGSVDLYAWYGRDWLETGGVRANFIASVDGAISASGLSRGLQTEGDNRVFAALRDLADVIPVGAGTARAEGYAAVTATERRLDVRRRYGLPDPLPIAVVSGSLGLDASSALFTGALPGARTIVVTTAASPADRRRPHHALRRRRAGARSAPRRQRSPGTGSRADAEVRKLPLHPRTAGARLRCSARRADPREAARGRARACAAADPADGLVPRVGTPGAPCRHISPARLLARLRYPGGVGRRRRRLACALRAFLGLRTAGRPRVRCFGFAEPSARADAQRHLRQNDRWSCLQADAHLPRRAADLVSAIRAQL